ncbi:hypothetical protein ONQ87_25235, partial [Salmonella enterica subsp. enterica serovar Virginia]|nr:hypothetical protein [Salmonella enterica subsp. enterica serovar Virginia]
VRAASAASASSLNPSISLPIMTSPASSPTSWQTFAATSSLSPEMKADQVLQDKVRSLKNVDIILNAQTTEVKGDGSKVVGLE